MIEAELPDGTVLEFPDGTDPAVIQRVVKQQLGVAQGDAQPEAPQPKEEKGGLKLGSLKENFLGDGEVDTIGEYIGDFLGTASAGVLRGIKGTLELPEMAARAVGAGYDLATGAEQVRPILDTATGRGLDAAYKGIAGAVGADPQGLYRQGESTAAEYAGTIGEFMGGAGAVGAAGKGLAKAGAKKIGEGIAKTGLTKEAQKAAALSGAGSEAFGQMAEGTELEPAARIVGAFAGPSIASGLTGIKNKTVQLTQKRAIQKPAVETARDAKNTSYKAFEDAGGKAYVNMDDVVTDIDTAIANDDLFIATDLTAAGSEYVDATRKAIAKHAGKQMNLAEVDKLRSGLATLHKQSRYDPRVGLMRDKLDDAIMNAPVTASGDAGTLLQKARTDFRRYKKIELFDEVMNAAEINAAVSGSGGNIVNNYRRAAGNILKSKSKRAQFDTDELEMMRKFVDGTLPENALRLIGKLSPSGNGLMAALNIAAVVSNPSLAFGTAAGIGSKVASDRMAVKSVEALKEALISGVPTKNRKIFERELRIFLGLQAGQEQ